MCADLSPDVSKAVAFPLHSADRARVRRLVHHPLPAIYPGSTALPCTDCQMILAVGPRIGALVTAHLAQVYCPLCVARHVKPGDTLAHLGNPDSRFEDQ